MFSTLPGSFTNALNILRPWTLQVPTTEIDEDGNVVMRPVLQLALNLSYIISLLPLFRAGFVKPKLGMERSMLEINDAIYVQTTLKERKGVESRLRTRAVADIQNMKRDIFLDEFEPAS